jgi:hypothetical protein
VLSGAEAATVVIEVGDRVVLAPQALGRRLDAGLDAATAEVLREQCKCGPLSGGRGTKGTVLRCIIYGAGEGVRASGL